MLKYLLLITVTILNCGIDIHPQLFLTFAQDYTQSGLPQGAKAWLGNGELSEVHFSPDGSQLVVSTSIGLWFYDPKSARPDKKPKLLRECIVSLSSDQFTYSHDGSTIASVSSFTEAGDIIHLWDVATGERKTTLTGDKNLLAEALAFSLDGSTITIGDAAGKCKVMNVITGDSKTTLTGHTGKVYSVVYSPNGNTIATGSLDKTVRLWDVKTGDHLRTLTGHKSYVSSIAFSPIGSTIASASADHTIRLWDTNTGNQKAAFKGYAQATSILFSPDGRTLTSVDRSGTVLLWDIETIH